ncbi:MAG TPA: hypothetical protein PKI77_12600 [Mycobacterium sp.]|nr:hypothetical protein [Mycobacterium sp.]
MEDHRGGGSVMSYKVVAPCVLAVDADGHTHHAYAGAVLEWLSPAQAEYFLAEGLVERVGDAAPALEADEAESDKPSANAKKAELVAWLVDNVLKEDGTDYTADELESLKVAELRDLVDSVE